MQVTVSHADQQVAQRVAVALVPLCDELSKRTDQAECHLSVAPGVIVADFFAKDGARGLVPVGVTSLALVCATNDPTQLRKYAEQMCEWARRKQEHQRLTLGLPFAIN